MSINLPPLPEPPDDEYWNLYSQAQMTAYATAAQTQLAAALIPQPGGTLLTVAEIDAEIAAAEALGASYLRTLLFLLAQRIEAAVLQKQREIFAASLAQEVAP